MTWWRTWRVSNERRTQNAERRIKKGTTREAPPQFCILHSAFCVLHSSRDRAMTEYAQTNEPELAQTWAPAPGLFGWLMETGHKEIGMRYIVTAMFFFAAAGIEAALMRMQLSQPNNTLLSPDRYNQLFTMHGTTMMFLFAVP